jgi:hypothetical protein
MSFRIPHSALRILLAIVLCFITIAPAFAQSDPVYDILSHINILRVQNGLLPLALSGTLSAAAQNHSDDMAATGNVDHNGSDGSTPLTRIQAAGYGHWNSYSWYGENIYGGQSATVPIAWEFWINSSPHLKNLLNTHYREVGIGVGHSANGGTYFTLDFGAQPNVLPFFITNDNLSNVDSSQLTLILSNEDNAPAGESGAIGRATQVRIAEGDDTSNANWQPWSASIDFEIANTLGSHTITIEYRDDKDRTAKYVRTVNLNSTAAVEPTPIDTLAPTATPTVENTIAPTRVALPTNTATPQPIATETIAPTDTPQPTATSTAQPTATLTATTQPTHTPKPSPTATATRSITATPQATVSATSDRPFSGDLTGSPDWLLPLIGGLQVLALIVGAIVIGKRLK